MGFLVSTKDVVDTKNEDWQAIISNVIDLEMNQNNLTEGQEILVQVENVDEECFEEYERARAVDGNGRCRFNKR